MTSLLRTGPGYGASSCRWPPCAPDLPGPAGVQNRGRLHDPGQDQVPEHLITQGIEPQSGEDTVQVRLRSPAPNPADIRTALVVPVSHVSGSAAALVTGTGIY